MDDRNYSKNNHKPAKITGREEQKECLGRAKKSE